MVKILAVYDADPAFGERLADYVNQKEKIPFTAMAFSSLDRLREYGEEHPIEILLVDECSRALVGDVKAKQVMVLCDGELVDGLDVFPSIYKYQSGDCIMREVLASYCSRPVEPSLALLGTRALVMGIYSPVNRCFKSSLALTIGQVMAKKETVLYLNLEEYSGLSRLINSEYKADLSDVLYLYRQGGYNWMKLKSMISNWGNMDYIPPVRYAEDLSQVAPEDMAQLIDRIARESGYDRLVVDVGQMGRGSLPILSIERVITIEDSAELQITQVPNLVRLETRNANTEGEGEITMSQLIKAALRMNPNRIVVGEVRGKEALDMLQAMNTGHPGSLSTGHGNSPRDMISRLETMVLMAADLPLAAIRNQIVSALDIMVHLGRLKDGKRRVLSIMRIGGLQNGEVELEPLFEYDGKEDRLRQKRAGTQAGPG